MNFLKSAYNTVKSKASSLVNKVSGAMLGNSVAAANTLIQQNAASAQPKQTKIPTGAYPISYSNPSVNQTYIPNQTLASGNLGATGTPFGTISYNPGGTINTLDTLNNNSTLRPSTYTGAPTTQGGQDPSVKQSTRESGIPYFTTDGVYIVPKAGWSGEAGVGGAGVSSVGATGAQGASGANSFGQNFGTGMGTTSALWGGQTSDEEKRKQQEKGGSTTVVNGNNNQPPIQQVANSLTAQANSVPSIEAPAYNGTTDVGWLQQTQEALNKITSSGLPESSYQDVLNKIQTNLFNAKTVLDQQMPTKTDYVEDTPEQAEWMKTQENPNEATRLMDQWKAEKTNLGELKASEQELNKTLKALNKTYEPVFKEIRENPNLPKSLARKKVEAIAFTQKEALDGIVDALAEVRVRIKDQQDAVNDAFQIAKFADDREARARDDQRMAYQLFISSGGIAGIPDNEMGKYAQKFGVSVKELKGAKEMSLKPEYEKVVNERTGDVTYYDKKTWKPVKTFTGVATKPTGGGGEIFKSGGGTFQGSELAQSEQKLLSTRGADGFVDPTVYLNVYTNWTNRNGLLSDFLKQFPPENYVNPANEWLPKEIMPKNKYSSAV